MIESTVVVVDTNVVSYLMKGTDEAKLYMPHVQNRVLAISFITVGELYFGAEKNNWGEKRRQKLEVVLRNYVVIPYDSEIAWCYARVMSERESKGARMSINDGWIAACTVRHGVPLITHNRRDFEGITGLDVITEISK